MLFHKLFESHPELLEFLNEVNATNDYTIEKQSDWSKALHQTALYSLDNATNQRSIELERTTLSLLILEALFENDPSLIGMMKPLGKPLSIDQFTKLHQRLITAVKTENPNLNFAKILRTALVLGDLGKVITLRKRLSIAFDIQAQDPDQFLDELLTKDYHLLSQHLPSIKALSAAEFDALKNLHAGFHYGHFAHSECDHAPLEKLQTHLKKHGESNLFLQIILQLCDTGAAMAHSNALLLNTSIVDIYGVYSFNALKTLLHDSPQHAYQHYLKDRLIAAEIKPELDENENLSQQNYWLGRLIAMFRIEKPKDGALLINTIKALTRKDPLWQKKLAVIAEYQAKGYPTPTYMPAFLNALKNHPRIKTLAADADETELEIAFRLGFSIIALALNTHRMLIESGKINPIQPANFNPLTGIVKSNLDEIMELYLSHIPANFVFDQTGQIKPLSMIETTKLSTDFYTYPHALTLSEEKKIHQPPVINKNLEQALSLLGFKNQKLYDQDAYLYRTVRFDEKAAALFHNLFLGGYLAKDQLQKCVDYLAKTKSFKIDSDQVVSHLHDAVIAATSPQNGAFNHQIFLKTFGQHEQLSPEDLIDITLYLSQTAFDRKFGQERTELKQSPWLQQNQTTFLSNIETLGLSTPNPPTRDKFDLIAIMGASYPRAKLRFEHFQKTGIEGDSVRFCTGTRELWAEIDGEEIIRELAAHYYGLDPKTCRFKEKNNRHYLDFDQPITEVMMTNYLLARLDKEAKTEVMDSDAQKQHWRATTESSAIDIAKSIVEKIKSGAITSDRIHLAVIAEQPFANRMTLQIQTVIETTLRDSGIHDKKVVATPIGPGIDQYALKKMPESDQNRYLAVFNSDQAAYLGQCYQTYRANHPQVKQLRDPNLILFSKRDETFKNLNLPKLSQVPAILLSPVKKDSNNDAPAPESKKFGLGS